MCKYICTSNQHYGSKYIMIMQRHFEPRRIFKLLFLHASHTAKLTSSTKNIWLHQIDITEVILNL